MMVLSEFQQTREPLVTEILPLFKQHARLNPGDTSEDALCSIYVAGAIGAAENYLLRDVFPTLRTWTGDLSLRDYGDASPFVARLGRASDLSFSVGEDVVDPTRYTVRQSVDPKTWGFEIVPGSDVNGGTLVATLGWETFAAMPPDLQQFILVAASAFYEVRELGNYTGGVGAVAQADFLPTYLLASWGNLTYA